MLTVVEGRGLGWKRDPPKLPGQEPDLLAAPRLKAIAPPDVATARHLLGATLNQGALGSCVHHTAMRAIRASHVRQGIVDPPLGSILYGYYLSRLLDHDEANDNGTFLRNAFHVAVKYGFPPQDLWPYSDDTGPNAPFRRPPPLSVFHAAYDQSKQMATPRYYRISSTGDERVLEIKRAIAAGFPVCFGTDVSVRFCNNDLGTDPINPPIGLAIAGGHALLIGGYTPDFAEIANSWGDGWGDQGWCRFSWDYIKWSASEDFWIVDTAPPFAEAP